MTRTLTEPQHNDTPRMAARRAKVREAYMEFIETYGIKKDGEKIMVETALWRGICIMQQELYPVIEKLSGELPN